MRKERIREREKRERERGRELLKKNKQVKNDI